MDYDITFNMRCSTCNDFLNCSDTSDREQTIWRIHEFSFWQQVTTIADYLTWSRKTRVDRALTIYRESDTAVKIEFEGSATVDVIQGRLTTEVGVLDLRTGLMEPSGGAKQVTCVVMSRRDGFALVRRYLDRPLPTIDDN